MKLALHGATGKMGAALLALVRKTGDPIVGAMAAPGCTDIGRDLGEVHGAAPMGVIVQADLASAVLGAEVVLDFSHASAVAPIAAIAARAGLPLVTGTTGLDAAGEAALDQAAESVPVVWAPNFSLGVQVLAEAVRHAAARLGSAFDVEIVEVHHRVKADAPSGTALRLAREVQVGRGALRKVFGREGVIGARNADEIAVLAVRGGDVVGDHSVHFLGQGERLEFKHQATSREVLARGALFAAHALAGRKPGRYTLAELLPSS